MHQSRKNFIYFLICVNVFFGAWFVINKDIVFHTDIARDFLLMENIVETRRPTLIGGRTGGIPGIFHGPFWLYLNLPAFLVGQGNPVVVGWFWVLLLILSLPVLFLISKKIFDEKTALLGTFLFSSVMIRSIPSLLNPDGALMLSPLFFYFFWRYLMTTKRRYLVVCLLTLGFIIQCQMAFGGPVLLLTILYLFFFLKKRKKLRDLSLLIVLLIPFSNYVLFDLRHNFLQTRSTLDFISGKVDMGKPPFWLYLKARLTGFFIGQASLLTAQDQRLGLLVTIVLFFIFFKTLKNAKFKKRSLYLLFFYFYIGYWLVLFLFRGSIWVYYYWPFLPLIIIVFSSSHYLLGKKIFSLLFSILFFINFLFGLKHVWRARDFIGQDSASWQFQYQVARRIFDDAEGEFGYYIFTPDLFGYPPRYALNYAQKKFPEKKSDPFEKKAITYLVIAPSDTPHADPNFWREHQVKIKKEPVKVINFPNGFKIEKYSLTRDELSVPSDPNLIQSLHFR